MKVEQILSQFQATGVETCFHDRHINPQIYAGLNGQNWGIKDYEARGGYAALRKIAWDDLHAMLIPVAELRRACVAEEAALQAKLADGFSAGSAKFVMIFRAHTFEKI